MDALSQEGDSLPQPIDHQLLSAEALRGVLEEIVTRGEPDETPIDARCHQLVEALRRGEIQLFWDPLEETVYLRPPSK